MPRKSSEARAAAYVRPGTRHPAPPADLPAAAAELWNEIVLDRPADFFRPGAQQLLAQYCRLCVVQQAHIARLETHPGDDDAIAAVTKLGGHLTTLAVKLRISIQSASRLGEKATDAKGPGKLAHLIGGHAVETRSH